MAVILYGIQNCDTVKKARRWLENNNIDYHYHDFRKDGLDRSTVRDWLKYTDWETLLNTRGTTWRKLPEEERQGLDEARVIKLLLNNPTLVKRPVLTDGTSVRVGFKEENYASLSG